MAADPLPVAPRGPAPFLRLTGDLPARRDVWRAPLLANDRYAAAFRDQLERTVPPPAVPEWERIGQQLRIVAERAVAGEIEPGPVPRDDGRRYRPHARAAPLDAGERGAAR